MSSPLPLRFVAVLAALTPFLSPQNEPEDARVLPDLDAQMAAWRAAHGASWRHHVDWETGHLEMLYGGSALGPFTPGSGAQEEWELVAREFLALTEPMHGVEGETLVHDGTRFLPLGLVGSTDKMTVRFRQVVEEVPVDGGFVNVLMSTTGELLSIQTRAVPRLAGTHVLPAVGAGPAGDAARAAFEERHGLGPLELGAPELVLAQVVEGGVRRAVLAWQVDARRELRGALPEARRYWVDAASAEVVESRSLVHHLDVGGTVSSNATPGTAPDTGSNPEQAFPMRYLRVTSSAGTVFTDQSGEFNFPGVSGPLQCTFEYVGSYADVDHYTGSEYVLNQSLSGTGNAVLMNPSPNEDLTAQANAYREIAALRDWIRSVNPADGTADFQAWAKVNRNDTCNAFFDGNSVNFYRSGGGCVNTAYSTVVAHEMGHWLNVLYGTGNGSDGMGEGNADVFAMYLYDTPIVGEDFCGNNCNIRTGTNLRQFCGDCCPGCHSGGQVHANGEVWMGAAWKVRDNLNQTHGDSAGDMIADLLFSSWMNGYDQSQIRSIIETQWLTLDDDDGNIGNGTPNYADIDSAFRTQGFPGVDLDDVLISNVTELPDTQDEVGPYGVDATVEATTSPPLQSVNLRYRTDGGSFLTAPMSPVGNDQYQGFLPGQPSPAQVEYYVEATDNAGMTATYPGDAPTTLLSFRVGTLTTFLLTDFEGPGDEGWAAGYPGDDASTGVWVRVDPIPTDAQPGDDHTPAPGTLCWVTGQHNGGSIGQNDVDSGTTTLVSPVFDASGLSDPEISYWRWYSNSAGSAPNADVFVVDISNNGGGGWVNVETVGPGGSETFGGWFRHSFRIQDVIPPTADMQLRFVASDLGQGSIVEAAVDDVEGFDLGPVGGQDCNGNGVPDDEDIATGTSADCNGNGVPDECDLASGASSDCNGNGTPDECETDCNGNGVPDDCDVSTGTSEDCNGNGVPDECDVSGGSSGDVNGNGIPDECETDCNGNGVPDDHDIATGTSADCNGNTVPDECDVASGTSADCNGNGSPDECETDCNGNGVPDDCDVATGTSEDCNGNGLPDECDVSGGSSNDVNGNGVPDECEVDCNGNGVPDDHDIGTGTSADCNGNTIPDECDVAAGTSADCNANTVPDECEADCNANGVPDECDVATGTSEDCNGNGQPDECDLANGTSADLNGNGVPDDCETDCNGNGVPDDHDIATGTSADCNGNSVPDECDVAAGTSADCNANTVPDECEADCNANGVPDDCDVSSGTSEDCNGNAVPDECDLANGTSTDLNGNGIPDECEADCNGNGVPDDEDIGNGTSDDCNGNAIPDECDVAGGSSADLNNNGIPDECEVDCNGNGVPDDHDIATGTSADCNGNAVPDECDVASGTSADCNANAIPDECEADCNANGVPDDCDVATGTSPDCNGNGLPDECDLANGTSTDLNGNGVPDECEADCNGNGVPDDEDIGNGTSDDCNGNAIPDECDVAGGSSADLNNNGIPDECEVDCNGNGVPDDHDIATGTSADCNGNAVPDECDVASGTSADCNGNAVPDECEADCNANGVPDDCDVATGTSPDCNGNGLPDECDLANGTSADLNGNGVPDECEADCNGNGVPDDQDIANGTSGDCNGNAIPDECDVASGTSADCNGNGSPDECETDCNGNGVPDDCDVATGTSPDCNGNGLPDECDVASGTSADCNGNGTPDECEADCNANGVPDDCDVASGTSEDCNGNGLPDECDLANGTSADLNGNGVPDECELDCNGNGVPDDQDIATGTSADCNGNAVPDECDIASGTSQDVNGNGQPDECECLAASFCQTSPNSAGPGALISHTGSLSIGQNDLWLQASGAPTLQSGVFYYGPNQILFPFGDGFRCVGGGVYRFGVITTDVLGNATQPVDYPNPPLPGGQIVEGSTWNFQFWYRDPLGPGGSGFNFSDGLELTFCP